MPENSSDICFILVEPAVPENIGAAARALKTMGFTDLRLVNPMNHLAEKAKWLAHGSADVLEKATVFSSLREALMDIDFAIGTTAKRRSTKQDYYTPEEAREIVQSKGNAVSKVAIVFGREESGLTNGELRTCDIATRITLKNPYPSINLAQAVMLYAYIFSSLKADHGEPAILSEKTYAEVKATANEILKTIEIDRNANLYHRLLERLAAAGADDSKLLLSVMTKLMSYLRK